MNMIEGIIQRLSEEHSNQRTIDKLRLYGRIHKFYSQDLLVK